MCVDTPILDTLRLSVTDRDGVSSPQMNYADLPVNDLVSLLARGATPGPPGTANFHDRGGSAPRAAVRRPRGGTGLGVGIPHNARRDALITGQRRQAGHREAGCCFRVRCAVAVPWFRPVLLLFPARWLLACTPGGCAPRSGALGGPGGVTNGGARSPVVSPARVGDSMSLCFAVCAAPDLALGLWGGDQERRRRLGPQGRCWPGGGRGEVGGPPWRDAAS